MQGGNAPALAGAATKAVTQRTSVDDPSTVTKNVRLPEAGDRVSMALQ